MNAADLLSPEVNQNPYPIYKRLRDHAPLHFHEGLNAYVLSRYQDVSQALKDPRFTVKNYEWQSEPLHGRTFIQMDGAEHSRYRNIVAPSIRGRQLAEKLVPMIERTAADLYAPIKRKTEADFAAEFAARFPVRVIVGLLGLSQEDEPSFLNWYRTFVDFIGDLGQTPEITRRAFQTKDEITAHLLPVIAEKRKRPADDLLSVMCEKEIDGVRMTDEEIKGFVSLLITAGGESTDKMLSLTLRNLLAHPEALAAVRQNRSLIDKAFVESMRYSPVTHRIMRITDAEAELPSGVIPAGSQVLLLLGAAQHDERQFDDPAAFRLDRDNDTARDFTEAASHVAFGKGRHFCVGSMLAKAEIDIAFNQLFDAFEDIRIVDPEAVKEQGMFTRGLSSLPIAYRVVN